MIRGVLITGNESALTRAVEIETAGRAERYALALIPDRFSGKNLDPGLQSRQEDSSPSENTGDDVSTDRASQEEDRILIDWNPGSPVSARTLVLAAENRLGCINTAILVCDPPSVPCTASGIGFADVEMLVNDHIKSWFFLVKELAEVFRARKEGTLALVYPETGGKNATPDLLGSAALGSFRSLTGGLLAAAFDESYLCLGFSGAAAGDEAGFAAFILKNIEEGNRRSNGKLHKYGKLGFFR